MRSYLLDPYQGGGDQEGVQTKRPFGPNPPVLRRCGQLIQSARGRARGACLCQTELETRRYLA